MTDWIIGDNSYSTSALARGIRIKGSHEARSLVELLKREKNMKESGTIALAYIDHIKRPHLGKYLYDPRYVGVTLSLCEESFNDAMYSIYEDIDDYDETLSSFNTWIDRKHHYAFLTNFRKNTKYTRSQDVSLDDEEITISHLFTTAGGDASESIANLEVINISFRKLPLADQELLKFVMLGETPTTIFSKNLIDVASVGSVKTAIFRARQKLKDNMRDAGWDWKF